MKPFILKSLLFTFIFCIWISITFFLLKATRSSTNPWSDASPNDLYVSNGETLKASKRNSLVDKSLACPTGFTAVSKNGNMLGCIETAGEWSSPYFDAIQNCYTKYWGTLPSFDQLYLASKNYTLSNLWNYERTLNTYAYNNWGRYYWALLLKTSDRSYTVWAYAGAWSYRCFIPR